MDKVGASKAKFFQMTKWLPTEIHDNEAIQSKGEPTFIPLDDDLTKWEDHLIKLGFVRGKDFVIRKRADGKRALFRRGQDAIRSYQREKPRGLKKPVSKKLLTMPE